MASKKLNNCICEYCKLAFHLKNSAVKKGRGKYCNKKCYSLGKKPLTKLHKQNVSLGLKKYNAKIQKHYLTGRIPWNKGIKSKISGENHYKWKGGITPTNLKIRHSIEYKNWIKEVFKRDNYVCMFCGKKGGYLEAHHIKSFSKYPDSRFNIFNGATLCKNCHDLTKNCEEIWEFFINMNLFYFNYE
jgi:hypothetical protein